MPVDLEKYHATAAEQERATSLLSMLPGNRRTVLDIGARDGYYSRLMAQRYADVTALDLELPDWHIPGVRTVAGDARALKFPDNTFDIVFCAEVLEHIPDVERACTEIARVARHEILIGVPFDQDIRVGRATCRSCGRISPPWGHINTFTEARLHSLFPGMQVIKRSLVGSSRARTTTLATWLMDQGKNPWHVNSEEGCIHCGVPLVRPSGRTLIERCCSAAAHRLNRIQAKFTPERPMWIHLLFAKTRTKTRWS